MWPIVLGKLRIGGFNPTTQTNLIIYDVSKLIAFIIKLGRNIQGLKIRVGGYGIELYRVGVSALRLRDRRADRDRQVDWVTALKGLTLGCHCRDE